MVKVKKMETIVKCRGIILDNKTKATLPEAMIKTSLSITEKLNNHNSMSRWHCNAFHSLLFFKVSLCF